jgi:hypothetical protein
VKVDHLLEESEELAELIAPDEGYVFSVLSPKGDLDASQDRLK